MATVAITDTFGPSALPDFTHAERLAADDSSPCVQSSGGMESDSGVDW